MGKNKNEKRARGRKEEKAVSTEQTSKESKIINVDIEKEMQKSFLDYSMSVIVSRALPDVRDGLKPVHRRILYTLFEDNLGPDKAYRKCANTVGSVLGRYHPHGDMSVYDALVRLAQDFSMRYLLVDGHGNFGSVDGDPPAAYRYTESRMSKIAVEMLTDIEKETVDFVPNYDDRLKEPVVLPSRFPNLLVNGSTGIAVGMATNIPPHNLGEVIDGMNYLIDNPEAGLQELMEHIKGPDFPTGAKIMGRSGIRSAYETGRGRIVVRACTEILEDDHGRYKIIVTELPYQVNKARLIENIADLVKERRIEGISNIDDHSDRDGMRIEIDLKREAQPQIVLNQLYTYTQLQTTFSVNMLAIVNGEPKILSLKEALKNYIDFQIRIVTRRTAYDLRKAQERCHILEGLKIAIDNIDRVIILLRTSKTIAEARERLGEEFSLDDQQTQAIVQMPLGRLTSMERGKIEKELWELREKITDYKDILSKPERLSEIVKEEAREIKRRYADGRRTDILAVNGEVDIEDLIPREECMLTLTNFGYIKRQKVDSYHTQRRGGRGIVGMTRRDEDVASEMFVTNTHDYILLFTNQGRAYRLKCYEVPEGSRTSKGMNIANLLPITSKERVTSMIRVPEFEEGTYFVMVTRKGVIKRTKVIAYDSNRKGGLIAIDLDCDDELTWVRMTDGQQELIVATRKGKAIRFKETDVRPVGRAARGVRAITLGEDDEVIGMSIVREGGRVLTVSEDGYGRLSPIDDYRLQTRGGKGVTNYHCERYADVAAIKVVDLDDDIIMISEQGIIIRIQAQSVRECARPSKGVRLMRIEKGNKVVTLARAPHEETINEDFPEISETNDVEGEDLDSPGLENNTLTEEEETE